MNKLAILCILILTATVKGADQYCYECSSKSALCRYSVYDGQYLSRTSCASSCFLRTEGNTIYRGCFDGWLGGIVNHDYVGCRTQEYLGEKVEWCFCKSVSDDKSYDQPCNGASKDALSKMALPYEEAAIPEIQLNAIKDKTLGFELDGNTKYFIPSETKDFKVEDKIKGENMITFDVQYEGDHTNNVVLNDEYALNMDDKTEVVNEEQPPDKTIIGHDPEGIEICITQSDGTYADPNDCTKYYHCSNNHPYRMSCSQGTVWNDSIKSCTFTMTPGDPCRSPGLFNKIFGELAETAKGTTPGHYKYGFKDDFETAWSSPND